MVCMLLRQVIHRHPVHADLTGELNGRFEQRLVDFRRARPTGTTGAHGRGSHQELSTAGAGEDGSPTTTVRRLGRGSVASDGRNRHAMTAANRITTAASRNPTDSASTKLLFAAATKSSSK